MNNVVSMVNYYILHKNADDSIVEYIKNKLDKSSVEDLIIIQIELLYTDPCDKLVSNLVNYINLKINDVLKNIELSSLVLLISSLEDKQKNIKNEISIKQEEIDNNFKRIQTKDLNNDNIFDEKDVKIASSLINKNQDNKFFINKLKSEINSIDIWLINLKNSLNKKIVNISLEELINNYINLLNLLNKNDYINELINKISKRIDRILFSTNLLETITDVIPELDRIYNDNSTNKNQIYKLMDYYIDLVDNNIKLRINKLEYEEKVLLKEKINAICYDILHNDIRDDDFKVLVINSYLKYL